MKKSIDVFRKIGQSNPGATNNENLFVAPGFDALIWCGLFDL